jgi:2-iminobutanoate/2-iminopropanoate deaminase
MGEAEILQYDPPRRWAAAARIGDLLYLAGETGMDPATGTIVAGGVESQTEQAIANIRSTLAHFGADLTDVFKLTVFLTDIADLPTVGSVRARHFTTPLPSSAIQVVALASPEMRVEIEAIARVPSER